MVNEEEWAAWLDHPCTKVVRDWAKREREELNDMWSSVVFTAAFDIEMAVKNAGATGACSIYEQVSEMDFNQIVESQNVERVGPGAAGQSGVDPIL